MKHGFWGSKLLPIAGIFLCLFGAHLAHATTYYVDNVGGLDTNNGISSSTPWQTIAKVNSSTFNPGDNILFKAGDTWREQLNVPSSGASGTPITFSSYGSGAQPIIDGANLVTSTNWTAYTLPNSTSNWTSEASGFNVDDSNYTYAITNASGTTVSSGTVSQANMRLSTLNGAAFVDFGVVNALTPYTGDLLTIKDSSSNSLTGYIGAAGTGQTYGANLMPDPGMDNISDFPAYNATDTILTSSSTCYSGDCLQVTPTTAWGNAWENFSASSGALLKTSVYATAGTETSNFLWALMDSSYNLYFNDYIGVPSPWTQEIGYLTVDSDPDERMDFGNETVNKTSLWDEASVTQVLTPATTGVVINPATTTQTVYYTSYATSSIEVAPVQVFEDGNRLTRNTVSTSSLAEGQWYLDTTNNRIWVYTTAGDNPSGHTMEASVIENPLTVNNSYVTISGLTVEKAGDDNVLCSSPCTGFTATGLTVLQSFYNGVDIHQGTNITVSSSTAAYNGQNGFQSYDDPGLVFSHLTAYDNSIYSLNQEQYDAGIKFDGDADSGAASENETVEYSLSYDNGIGQGINVGSGIDADTVGGGFTAKYNRVYGNNEAGIFIDAETGPATVAYNVSYDNGVASSSWGGFGIWLDDDWELSMTGNLAYSNTTYGNYNSGIAVSGPSPDQSNGCTDNIVENNIIVDNAVGEYPQANFTADGGCENSGTDGSGNVYAYNDFGPNSTDFMQWGSSTYYSTLASWQATSGQTNNLNSNPLFISTSTNNFALQSGSPAIDTGVNLSTSYDLGLDPASTWPSNIILDNENNYGSGWDIGAYVYTQTSTPSVSFISPSSGSTISGSVTLSASSTAVAPASISSLQFYLDGSPLGSPVTSTSSPNTYSYTWNTMGANGSHTLYALATDNYGNTASSSQITITVDNTPPVVSITSPANGATVSGTTSIVASSSDAISGVSSVSFYIDGSLLGESTSSPYTITWDTTQTSNGAHSITAIAVDGAGNATTSEAVTLGVSNSAPPPGVVVDVAAGYAPSAFITSLVSSTTESQAPSTVATSTTASTTLSTSSLETELDSLLAELQSLEAQAGGTTSPNISSSYVFTRNLSLWSTGSDVTALQTYLIDQDKGPAAQKLKAHGTTTTFGILTYNALVEFQESVGIVPASGYFGPVTRAYTEAHS